MITCNRKQQAVTISEIAAIKETSLKRKVDTVRNVLKRELKPYYSVLRPSLYLTCRCRSFFLDVVYSARASTYCDRNGNINTFSDLDAAKASCSADDDCVGLFDSCGDGTKFKHCSTPLSTIASSCGSILYQPSGK